MRAILDAWKKFLQFGRRGNVSQLELTVWSLAVVPRLVPGRTSPLINILELEMNQASWQPICADTSTTAPQLRYVNALGVAYQKPG